MTLLHAGVDTTVIALWLGHADVRSTDAYLHADMTIKERPSPATPVDAAPAATARPTDSSPSSKACNYADPSPRRPPQDLPPRRLPRHSRGVGIGRSMRTSA